MCGELFQSLYLFELFLKRPGARLKGGGRAAGVGSRWCWRQGGQVACRRQGAHADQAGARLWSRVRRQVVPLERLQCCQTSRRLCPEHFGILLTDLLGISPGEMELRCWQKCWTMRNLPLQHLLGWTCSRRGWTGRTCERPSWRAFWGLGGSLPPCGPSLTGRTRRRVVYTVQGTRNDDVLCSTRAYTSTPPAGLDSAARQSCNSSTSSGASRCKTRNAVGPDLQQGQVDLRPSTALEENWEHYYK